MIKADFENGIVLVKANQKIILENEFMMIYYALEKTNPDVLDRATDMIERWTKEGLDADDFIKKVVDMHGLE
jgi:hypothetical protein